MAAAHRGNTRAWTVPKVATHIGMHRKFVQREIAAGEIRASRFGREHRIALREVNRYCTSKGWPKP